MSDVICNTSALQYLYQAGLLNLLPELFGQVHVPQAVLKEINEGKNKRIPLPDLEGLTWITIRPVKDKTLLPLVTSLGDGEKEVLALGLAAKDALLVLDDRKARQYAESMGLNFTGVVGILMMARERGLLDSIGPALDRLEMLRFRLSAKTREIILGTVGE